MVSEVAGLTHLAWLCLKAQPNSPISRRKEDPFPNQGSLIVTSHFPICASAGVWSWAHTHADLIRVPQSPVCISLQELLPATF